MKQAQSYMSVMLNGRFTVYQMRIFLKIVQRAQLIMKSQGGKYSDYIDKAYNMDGYNVNFAVAVSEIVGASCHNYEPLKQAIVDMEKKWIVSHYDWDKKVWYSTSVVYNARIEEQSGILRWTCADWVINYIADFRKYGYREYDYNVAMSIRNPSTAKLYLLTCSQNKPLEYKLEYIKKWLGMEGVYKRATDFARKCLEPARRELEEKNVNGFAYEFIHEREGKKTSRVVGVKIIPVKRGKAEVDAAAMTAGVETELPPTLINYLSTQVGMKTKEMWRVKDDLKYFTGLKDWQWKLVDIVDRARRKRKNHGWIIQAIRGEINKSDKGL